LCDQIDGIPISGIVVIGDGQAARSIALSGNAMKVPVLWAKGGTAQLQENSEVSFDHFLSIIIMSSMNCEFVILRHMKWICCRAG
jgi:hypothetical protein